MVYNVSIMVLGGNEKTIEFILTLQELGLWNKDNHFVVSLVLL